VKENGSCFQYQERDTDVSGVCMYMMRPDGSVNAGKDRVFRERIASAGKFYSNIGRRVVMI